LERVKYIIRAVAFGHIVTNQLIYNLSLKTAERYTISHLGLVPSGTTEKNKK
jgi:hypothetical protein